MDSNLVAIVGRPNVGKSALFNRLVGRRVSIVDSTRGVTRDRLFGTVNWIEKEFKIVDTGGIEFEIKEKIKNAVREQTEIAITDAACVLFVVDAQDGVTPLDRDIMNLLRPHNKPILLVVNKVDNEQIRPSSHNFLALGVKDVYPVSAVHGLGIGNLLDKISQIVKDGIIKPEAEPVKIAIVGKPNVGKSSFLNAILKEKRVIVDDQPGTTRDSIDTLFTYKEKECVLIDTAGMKRKRKVENAPEFFSVTRSVDTIRRCDIVVLMIDSKMGPTEEDSKIADMAISEWKGLMICINKWDLMKDITTKKYAQEVFDEMPFAGFAPIEFISALKGDNIFKVLDEVFFINEQLQVKIPTSLLNKVISEAQEKLQHPYKGRKRFKIYYVTQTGTKPPTFTFFVNDESILDRSYEIYLLNRLREKFGFEGVPIRLRFKNRR